LSKDKNKEILHNFTIATLKGPSQLPPFSMPSKLFTLVDEAISFDFSVSCVPEGMFDHL